MAPIRSALLVSTLLLLVTACGGGGGAVVAPAGTVAPTARIVFPPMDALTTTDTVILRGEASSTTSTIANVQANGVSATSTDGFGTWRVEIPLQRGDNPIVVSVTDATGLTNNTADTVGVVRRDVLVESGIGIGADANGNLYVLDSDVGLLRITVPGEVREIVADDQIGTGPSVERADDLAFDATNHFAYVLDGTEILAVDPSTGNRAALVLSGTPFTNGAAIGVNAAGSIAIVANRDGDVYRVDLGTGFTDLLAPATLSNLFVGGVLVLNNQALVHSGYLIESINLTTGARAIVSQSSIAVPTGTGPDLGYGGNDLARHPTNPSLMLALTSESVLAVDPSTGDRSTVSGDGVGTGPTFELAQSLVATPGGVFVLTSGQGVFHVDVATGARVEVSSERVGTGPYPSDVDDVAVDPQTGTVFLANGTDPAVAIDPATGTRVSIPGTDTVCWIDCDPGGGTAYALTTTGEIFSLDLTTGAFTEVSGGAVGSGPAFVSPIDLSHGPGPGGLVVNDEVLGVVLVNPVGGDRTILTPVAAFTNPEFGEPYGVTADQTTATVFVADNGADKVFEIDGVSGAFVELADLGALFFVDINDAVYQAIDGNVYVAAESGGEIYRVTPGTGAAVEVSSATAGVGPAIGDIYRVDAAPDSGVAFVPDGDDKLVALDLLTGQRVVVAR